jgi:alkanesulfonate monooxygenase SsuD/methylene tetrahydromethanopterin reductase-like flavin-dependent oxidoreductase (luciferase family)
LLKYGIFDWLEHQDSPLDEIFEQRLQMLEQADQSGFHAYHVAEHQGTPLSLDSSPAVFMSAATQRTSRLRLIPTVFCLPWYNPFRLYNEICLLDQLSRGRIEVGVGRGVSPIESAYYGVTSMEQAREMFAESLDVIISCFKNDKLDFSGKHYDYEGVELWNKPYQKPYPPLWYPTSNIESVPYVAREGFSTSHNFAPNDVARPHIALLKEELAKSRDLPNRLNGHVKEPLISNTRHIYIAPTDAEAVEQATPAFLAWSDHISYLSGRFNDRPRDSLALEKRMANGTALVGSPDTVRAQIQEMVDETGINYFMGVFYFGDLKLEQVLRSMDLFTSKVIGEVNAESPSAVA